MLPVHEAGMMGDARGKSGMWIIKEKQELRRFFKLCSLNGWEMLTPPAEIEAIRRRLGKYQGI